MVVHDVEDHFNVRLVEQLDHSLALAHERARLVRGAISLMGSKEANGVVAPIVCKTKAGETFFGNDVVDRQKLHGRYPEAVEMLHERWMAKPRVGAA